MDDHEPMWDSLALGPLDPIPSTSPPHSPSRSPEPPWWNRRSNSPQLIQVRLDGEVADHTDLTPPSLDALLPLSVASGRIEKPSPSKPHFRPHPSHFHVPTSPTLSHIHSPPHCVKQEPTPLPVHTPLSASPQTPTPPPPPAPVSLPLVTKPPPPSVPARPLLAQHPSPPAHPRVPHRPASNAAASVAAAAAAAVSNAAPGVVPSPSAKLSAARAAAVAHAATAVSTPVTAPHMASPTTPSRPASSATATATPSQLRSLSVTPPHPSASSPVQVQNPQRPAATTPSSSAPSESTSASLKEKREREARQFPKEVLTNLDGTTSAEVRKMNATERELVLYKRKLRNRESARRSRQKRQATLGELQEEIDDLMQLSGRMVEVGLSLREENSKLHERLSCALAELKGLRGGMYPNEHGASSNAAGSSQAAAMKMKLGG